ncbi:MAG: DUF4129 domain-containing protein [Anaerolineales bacterium]
MKSFSPIRLNPWREIAILMIILMEVSWVTPWFRAMTPETYAVSALRVFLILVCIILFAHVIVRLMDYLRLKKSIRQGLMIAFIFIGIIVGIKTLLYAHEPMSLVGLLNRPLRSFTDIKTLIPVEFIVIISVLVGFWRGLSIAQEHVGPSSVMDHFWIGIVMYVAFIFFNTIVTGETPGDFFYLFLFSSLVAMCAARLTVVGMVRGGLENKFNRFWFLGIILAASLVVALSSLLGGVIGDQFAWIGVLILGLFGSVLIFVWLLINPIVTYLITLLSNLFHNSKGIETLGDNLKRLNEMMSGLGQRILDMIGNSGIGLFVSRFGPAIKTIILVAIIVIVILGVVAWMAINLWRDRERRLTGEDQKTSIKAENILRMLLDILRQGWSEAINSLEQMTDFKHRQRIRAAARIRQVYAELMELCESLGHPRADAQTPLEYLPKLEKLFPEFQLEVGLITEAYLVVRYGQLPETRKEVEGVEAAWKKIHSAGHELLTELKHVKKK